MVEVWELKRAAEEQGGGWQGDPVTHSDSRSKSGTCNCGIICGSVEEEPSPSESAECRMEQELFCGVF